MLHSGTVVCLNTSWKITSNKYLISVLRRQCLLLTTVNTLKHYTNKKGNNSRNSKYFTQKDTKGFWYSTWELGMLSGRSSDTIADDTKQKIGRSNHNGKIESSFERLLQWRESEHLRVLNLAEQYDSKRQDKVQLDSEGAESEQPNQAKQWNDWTISLRNVFVYPQHHTMGGSMNRGGFETNFTREGTT